MCEVTEIFNQLPFISGEENRPILKVIVTGGAFDGKSEWVFFGKKSIRGDICAIGIVKDTKCQNEEVKQMVSLDNMKYGQSLGETYKVITM